MTVAAVDAVVTDVMFMTELNRLLPFDPLTGVPGGPVQFDGYPQQGNNDKESAINRDLCERVCAVMEDLWHRRRLCESGASQPVLWQTNNPQTFRLHDVYCKVTRYFTKWIVIFKSADFWPQINAE
jgi:hypothetical protein